MLNTQQREKQVPKSRERQVTIGLGLIAAGSLAVCFSFLLWLLSSDLLTIILAIIIGIAGAGTIRGLTFLLETRKKMTAVSRFALTVIMVIFFLFIALSTIAFDFDFDLANNADFSVIAFAVTLVVTLWAVTFLFGGVKLIHGERWSKRKTRTFMALTMVSLVLVGFSFSTIGGWIWNGTIVNGTGYNDGPWATWHGDPNTGVTISWLTAQKNSTTLVYGTEPAHLTQTYTDLTPSNLHEAILSSLLTNTTYYYRIPESFTTPPASTIFKFHTAASNREIFRFAVVGDKQPTEGHLLTSNGFVADSIIAQNYDFVCQVGDLASSGNRVYDWHLTLESLARIGGTSPLMMTIGNHDWSGITGSTNWRSLFPYPWAGTGASNYYSFDFGIAHFVMIDNFELFYRISAGQLAWIEQDIINAKARGATWIFCFFHLSMLTTGTSGLYEDLQRLLVPLFDKLAVDAAFYGHDHHYEHYNYTYGANDLVFAPDHQ